MDLLSQFRLTKTLHDQVEVSGDEISGVLNSWNDKEYRGLCEYVVQCRKVVPKYIVRLSRLTGLAPADIVLEIVGAQAPGSKARSVDTGRLERINGQYLPEDSTDRDIFVRQIVEERQRYM